MNNIIYVFYKNSLVLNNVEDIDLNFDDLLKFTFNSQNVFLIGQRSGIFDILKYTNSQKIIFYHQYESKFFKYTTLLKDVFSKNLYEYVGEKNGMHVWNAARWIDPELRSPGAVDVHFSLSILW